MEEITMIGAIVSLIIQFVFLHFWYRGLIALEKTANSMHRQCHAMSQLVDIETKRFRSESAK